MPPPSDLLRFMEIYKIYLAFTHFVEVVAPVRRRIPRDHFNHSEREQHSFYKDLMRLVEQGNDAEFRKFTRLSIATYKRLYNRVHEKLQKYSQRHPISPDCRLLLTLTYLAYNSPRSLLTMAFRVGLTTLRNVIIDTVEVIVNEMSADYIRDITEDEYLDISEDIRKATGLPNCMGSIDAIDIKLERKQSPVVLVASSNTKYQLYNIDLAMADEMPDRDNIVSQLVEERHAGLLPDFVSSENGEIIPSYFVVSNGLPFVKHTIRPFPGQSLSRDKQYFNECMRVCSDYTDNAFGVLLYKWRVLYTKIAGLPSVAQNIIKSCVILHNFAIEHDKMYLGKRLVDHIDEDTMEYNGGIWRSTVILPRSETFCKSETVASREAFDNRQLVLNYIGKEEN